MKKLALIIAVLFIIPKMNSQELQLMSYNIKYANENDGENSWSKRKDWITSQVKYYSPDVLGLQEAVKSQLDLFSENMDGYEVLGVGREGADKGEFSAILYNTGKLEKLESDTFWLSETPEKVSRGWDADFNRICTYALFQEKESGKKFYVFNTHFDHVGDKARLESSKLIIKKIAELNKEEYAVFLMGDFNLEPETEGIEILSSELERSREKAELSFGPVGTFNGYKFHEQVTRRIDYIFSNDNVVIRKFAVITDSKDLKYPSDHFPVIVTASIEE
ncbi:endonuclease/exonuclease/phosphatase family protein [Christiangramia sp. SM2212]|uniref:Endonuclease/exonuclease/phosphatase family protein n=1 Tax=Christiangramia sediminicola TaxID=3073267 RepID=A0ABU1ES53_9FLAO|nr:endonuclease/exonuclease/phosphatase family protein [Christiangramia sp. SM2212]MDR5590998.1 endonuclease/exonuclease/phosphatase family protein [Christiangramia sp. SM2212]